jgi:hypothetical protein
MKEIGYFLKAAWKYLKPVLVLVIAYYAFKWLLIPGIIYAILANIFNISNGEPNFWQYEWNLAMSIDQTLNVALQYTLNDTMIKNHSKDKYGNADETISGVTGKNQLADTLTWFGKLVNSGLNKLEKNHSINSIEYDE